MRKYYNVKMQNNVERIYGSEQELAAGTQVVVKNTYGYKCGVVTEEISELPENLTDDQVKNITAAFEDEDAKKQVAEKKQRMRELKKLLQQYKNDAFEDVIDDLITKYLCENDADFHDMQDEYDELKEELGDDSDADEESENEDDCDCCCDDQCCAKRIEGKELEELFAAHPFLKHIQDEIKKHHGNVSVRIYASR